MKVFVLSWRQSLAAAALAAVLSPAASDTFSAAAAEGQPEAPAAKAEREGDRDEAKREREAPKPEAREGREGERREGPREGDRPAVRREGEGDRREAPSPELLQKRRQLEEQAHDIRRKLETLRPEQDAEARELRGALSRIEAQLRETEPRREAGDREPLMRRLEELKAAMQRAREAGNREEVERLEREGREVLQQLGERPGDRPRPEGEAAEIQRRMQHLHAAIENLRAAGLNAQADALAGEAERWMRERGMPPGQPPRAEGRERPDMAPFQAQVERAMGEMREQMQEMRRQMEEMRRHLQELSAKQPR